MTSHWPQERSEQTDGFSAMLAAMTERRALSDQPEISGQPMISDQDVDALRQAFYREGRIDPARAADILRANRALHAAGHEASGAWTEFYLEALTDVFLDRGRQGCRIAADAEAALLCWLGDQASIADIGERRLVTRILLLAVDVSERLERRFFGALCHHLLHRSEGWLGGRAGDAGIIDVQDLHLVRRLVCRKGACSEIRVSRASVDVLLELDCRGVQSVQPRAWHDLLTESAAFYLISDRGSGPAAAPAVDGERSASLRTMLSSRYAGCRAARLYDEIEAAAARLISQPLTPARQP